MFIGKLFIGKKWNLFIVLFVILLLGTSVRSMAIEQPANPLEKPGWILTAHDEFDGPTLNTDLWIPRYIGYRVPADVGNAEYVFRDGCLVLQITEDMPDYNSNGMRVSSIQTFTTDNHHGSAPVINSEGTINKFTQRYGYFEVRAKTTEGSGMHTAFWTLEAKPQGKEFDVVEKLGKDTGYLANDYYQYHDSSYINVGNNDLDGEFHIYALETSETGVKFYFDGQIVKQTSSITEDLGFFIGLYENAGWTGTVDPSIPYPKEFIVDYFRAYEKAPTTKVEVEDMTLTNYTSQSSTVASNDQFIQTSGTGTATYSFQAPSSTADTYTINTYYFDENDGESDYKLYVNNTLVDSWTANEDLGSAGVAVSNLTSRVTGSITLDDGDEIKIEGTFNGWEYARLDYIEIIAE